MEKQMLRCDICGGLLKMQANREAVCENCGMAYSIESLREKFNGLKVSVTGSRDDVAQWKELVNKYLEKHDYTAAKGIIKKILEAVPTDQFASTLYEQMQDWKYLQIVNGTLVSYRGKGKRLVLPNNIKEIGEKAFRESEIEYIVFQNGVTTIQRGAFAGCHHMKCNYLPDSLTQIEPYAFADCYELNVSIPETVISLGSYCFCNSALEKANLSKVTEIGTGVFSGCQRLKEVVLSSTIMRIPDYLFSNTGIQEIVINSDVGEGAFADCRQLRKIEIKTGVIEIGRYAFRNCQQIESIVIPKGIESLSETFSGCTKLKKVVLPDGLKNIQSAFEGCIELEEVSIPVTVDINNIDGAFAKCNKLSSVNWYSIDRYYEKIKSGYDCYWEHYNTTDTLCYLSEGAFCNTPFWRKYLQEKHNYYEWTWHGLCRYCGGEFKGLFTKVCSKCGKTKDY